MSKENSDENADKKETLINVNKDLRHCSSQPLNSAVVDNNGSTESTDSASLIQPTKTQIRLKASLVISLDKSKSEEADFDKNLQKQDSKESTYQEDMKVQIRKEDKQRSSAFNGTLIAQNGADDTNVDVVDLKANNVQIPLRGKPIGSYLNHKLKKSRKSTFYGSSRSMKNRKSRSLKGRYTDSFAMALKDDDLYKNGNYKAGHELYDDLEEANHVAAEKAPEEKSFEELFPDLMPQNELQIIRKPFDYFCTNPNSLKRQVTDFKFDEQAVPVGPVLFPKGSLDSVPKAQFQSTTEELTDLRENAIRPDNHYIRFVDPNEDEVVVSRIEYDMDEQDLCWLKAINHQRQLESIPPVEEAVFERIIDILEKQWFHLTKDLNKPVVESAEVEESPCAICNDTEVENSNAIVFCDGCNLAVHQECYGVPYIPEGQWLCRKCMLSPEKPVSCVLCPNEDGAFKQTTTNQWAHLLCALWIPEVQVTNPVYMEPVDGVDKIPKSRWKLTCTFCKKRFGACIQCYKPSCFTAYHVTCARKAGLYMKVRHLTTREGNEYSHYKSFCTNNTKAGGDNESVVTGDTFVNGFNTVVGDNVDSKMPDRQKSESLETSHPSNHFSSQPIAPDYILQVIMHLLEKDKLVIRQKHTFVKEVCKFWSLKRKSRRGAPLLKRLHLEPWTMFSAEIKQTEASMLARYKTLSYLRNDLETVRILMDLIKKREREKLKRARLKLNFLYLKLMPLKSLLKRTFEELIKLDKTKVFMELVSANDVPDYYTFIKNPMCFRIIKEKIENFDYKIVEQFEADINLIYFNCLTYNKADTYYARLALKMKEKSDHIMSLLKQSYSLLSIEQSTGILNADVPRSLFQEHAGYSHSLAVPVVPTIQMPPINKRSDASLAKGSTSAGIDIVVSESNAKPQEVLKNIDDGGQNLSEDSSSSKKRKLVVDDYTSSEDNFSDVLGIAEKVKISGRRSPKKLRDHHSMVKAPSVVSDESKNVNQNNKTVYEKSELKKEQSAKYEKNTSSATSEKSKKKKFNTAKLLDNNTSNDNHKTSETILKQDKRPAKVKPKSAVEYEVFDGSVTEEFSDEEDAASESVLMKSHLNDRSSKTLNSDSVKKKPTPTVEKLTKRATRSSGIAIENVRLPKIPLEHTLIAEKRRESIKSEHEEEQEMETEQELEDIEEDGKSILYGNRAKNSSAPNALIIKASDKISALAKNRRLVNGFDLCWVKANGFPWFPAEIVPPEEADQKHVEGKYLACYFDRDLDRKRTWAWLSKNEIEKFDFGSKDVEFLKSAKRKNKSMRTAILNGYKVACLSRNKDPMINISKVLKK